MPNYYMNMHAQSNGDHEVHAETCSWLKYVKNPRLLGNFSSCQGAVAEAKKYDSLADGCKHCSPACHTR